MSKQQPGHPNNQDSDSEPENVSAARTSTPIKTNATSSETTPSNSLFISVIWLVAATENNSTGEGDEKSTGELLVDVIESQQNITNEVVRTVVKTVRTLLGVGNSTEDDQETEETDDDAPTTLEAVTSSAEQTATTEPAAEPTTTTTEPTTTANEPTITTTELTTTTTEPTTTTTQLTTRTTTTPSTTTEEAVITTLAAVTEEVLAVAVTEPRLQAAVLPSLSVTSTPEKKYSIPWCPALEDILQDDDDALIEGPVKIQGCEDSGTANEKRACDHAYDGLMGRQPNGGECYSSSTAKNVFVQFNFQKRSRVKYVAMLAKNSNDRLPKARVELCKKNKCPLLQRAGNPDGTGCVIVSPKKPRKADALRVEMKNSGLTICEIAVF